MRGHSAAQNFERDIFMTKPEEIAQRLADANLLHDLHPATIAAVAVIVNDATALLVMAYSETITVSICSDVTCERAGCVARRELLAQWMPPKAESGVRG